MDIKLYASVSLGMNDSCNRMRSEEPVHSHSHSLFIPGGDFVAALLVSPLAPGVKTKVVSLNDQQA